MHSVYFFIFEPMRLHNAFDYIIKLSTAIIFLYTFCRIGISIIVQKLGAIMHEANKKIMDMWIQFGISEETFYKYSKADFIRIKRDEGCCDYKHVVEEIKAHDAEGWAENEAWCLYMGNDDFSLFATEEDEHNYIEENKDIINDIIRLGWHKNLHG